MKYQEVLELDVVLINELCKFHLPIHLIENCDNHGNFKAEKGEDGDNVYEENRTAATVSNDMTAKCA